MINDDNLSVNDFGKICRTCLAEGEMKFLYENCPKKITLLQMLMSITFLQFTENESLPLQICLNCESELTRAYRYIQKCLEVDKKLRKCFEDNESNINNITQPEILKCTTSTQNQIPWSERAVPENELQIKSEINVAENERQPEIVEIKHEISNEKLLENQNIVYTLDDSNEGNFEFIEVKSEELSATENNDNDGNYDMSSDESDVGVSSTPSQVLNEANAARLDLLPRKSAELYEKHYNLFIQWCKDKNIKKYSENVLLAYFSTKAKNYKSSTLWSMFSMIKTTLIAKNKVDIGTYSNLIAYLKKQGKGYKPKKSMVFTRSEINKFLFEAPDDIHLMHKVCLIMGIAGACCRQELRNINIDNIHDGDDILIIKIPDSKTGRQRIFTITDEICDGVSALHIYRKYANIRPIYVNHKTFFINYRKGKCCNQVVGVHTFANVPSIIAKYLNLPNTSSYTGHCFRRTSALLRRC